MRRANHLCEHGDSHEKLGEALGYQIHDLRLFLERTEQVCDTASRRVLKGETVPNAEKLFSMFEPHTQLYKADAI